MFVSNVTPAIFIGLAAGCVRHFEDTADFWPAAIITIVLNLLLPADLDGDQGDHETQVSELGEK